MNPSGPLPTPGTERKVEPPRPVGYLTYGEQGQDEEFSRQPLTAADIAAGCKQTPVYQAPKTSDDLKDIIGAWLDADDATHWGAFEHALDEAIAPEHEKVDRLRSIAARSSDPEAARTALIEMGYLEGAARSPIEQKYWDATAHLDADGKDEA